MDKTFAVARNEYLNAVRSKAFVIGVLMMPVFMTGTIVVQALTKDKLDLDDRRFAVVDPTGRILPAIEEAARARDEHEVFEVEEDGTRHQVKPRFIPEAFTPEGDGTRPDVVLSERVRQGELFAFLAIGPGVLASEGEGSPAERGDASIVYSTDSLTYQALPDWLQGRVNDTVRGLRLEEAGIDPQVVSRLSRWTRVRRVGLVDVDEEGEVIEGREDHEAVVFLAPAAAMFLLLMLVMMSAPTLLNTVLEEKMQKIAELLVASVSPFRLLMGKVIGAVLVAATLSVLYLGAVIWLAHRYDVLGSVPAQVFFWFPVFELLALFMYGSIFAAFGAACSEMRDAQSLMGPVMLVILLPVFCWTAILQAPNSAFASWISLFPLATPMLMMLRLAASPGPPVWQVLLGLGLTTAAAVLCVAAAAKIFRIGILSHGQAPTLRRLVRWVFSK